MTPYNVRLCNIHIGGARTTLKCTRGCEWNSSFCRVKWLTWEGEVAHCANALCPKWRACPWGLRLGSILGQYPTLPHFSLPLSFCHDLCRELGNSTHFVGKQWTLNSSNVPFYSIYLQKMTNGQNNIWGAMFSDLKKMQRKQYDDIHLGRVQKSIFAGITLNLNHSCVRVGMFSIRPSHFSTSLTLLSTHLSHCSLFYASSRMPID